MTILTNTDIAALSASTPNPLIAPFDSGQLQPASYDLRIGTIFRDGQIINASHRLGSSPVVIQPGEVVTMLTLEELELPDDIAGTAYAMNSQSSEGLLVLNPGHVDPGYKGPLSMVALNLRRVPLPLCLGESIFTLVFDELKKSANPPYQSGTTSRRAREIAINKKVIEKSMVSISDLIATNSTFVTERRVDQLISKHWMTWVVTAAAIIAALFSVLAVFQNSADRTALPGSDAQKESHVLTRPTEPVPSPPSLPPSQGPTEPAGRQKAPVQPSNK